MERACKTTVYLDEAEYECLKTLAGKQSRPAAELIRDAVSEYVARRVRKRRPRSIGAGASGRGNLSERVDGLLKGFGR